MTAYPDTSLLVALFVNEPGTARAQSWLAEQAEGSIRISDWTEVEFLSAIGVRYRRRDLTRDEHDQILAAWQDLKRVAEEIAINDSIYRQASLWLSRPDLALRSGDSVHLAVAEAAGITLWTFDNGLRKAGRALGLAVSAP